MPEKLKNKLRYTESEMQSVDILRLVIPQISKHKLAASPTNYAIWYEYYRSKNLQLKQAINEYLEQGKKITNELLESFFDTYISDLEAETLKQVQNEIIDLISSISETTKATDSSALDYHQSLQKHVEKMGNSSANQDPSDIVSKLINETQNMQLSIQTMRKQMDDNQLQIDELRDKLDSATAETLRDILTGLANRKGFSKAFEEAIEQSQETNSSTSMLMVDIDHFKKVNDTYGHLIGDQVIKFISDTLTTQTKGQDTASRFGGEEFAVLLPNTALKNAQIVAESIRIKIENAQLRRANNQEPIGKVTISIGITDYQLNETIESFIDRADTALYQSKKNGRNQVTTTNSTQ